MVFRYGDYKQCDRCGCENVVLVKRVFRNGAVNYQYECMACGNSSGSVKKETIPKEVIEKCPDYDETIKNMRIEAEHSEFLRNIDEINKRKEEEKAEYRSLLADYYESAEWQYRRKMRLEYNKVHFGGLCERCRKNKATLVHHRSYRILGGKEHTFDLEALCSDCHSLIHKHLRGYKCDK